MAHRLFIVTAWIVDTRCQAASLLLQGKSDTLRTGEGVPGAQSSASGRSFESCGGCGMWKAGGGYFFSCVATGRMGVCLLG
jgi:hypothetical protein